ncbi:hypothetical protein [Actinoplanes siamensis]|uniref:Uncharacterized protein n=1 Tax=Actinoplanes siamensis TaxID=1223317 RepID=A0A919TM69_9ACTN|nr:hypothetical protein [Actinoplanes siamensis]GIF07357.1 hypothetical protein Asi03nite_48950 [Actinoplanes siamensis]
MATKNEESGRRTAEAMRATAEELEQVEATMHDSARTLPDPAARARLHGVANEVTATAADIDHRADGLPAGCRGSDPDYGP